MYNSERMMKAIGNISDDKIEKVSRALGYQRTELRKCRAPKRMGRVLSIAAVVALILALGVTAYGDFLYENAGPAVLAWIIEGAKRIIARDYKLKNPKIVQDAIDAYRGQNDWLNEFLEECCEVDPSYTEKSGELYQEYRSYCLRMGEFARSTTDFYGALAQRDFERHRTKKGVLIRGLRIKSEFDG